MTANREHLNLDFGKQLDKQGHGQMWHTSTCWQIWMSLAIWFSSSLFLFTRLVKLFSSVCCWDREGRRRGRNRGTTVDISIGSGQSLHGLDREGHRCKQITDSSRLIIWWHSRCWQMNILWLVTTQTWWTVCVKLILAAWLREMNLLNKSCTTTLKQSFWLLVVGSRRCPPCFRRLPIPKHLIPINHQALQQPDNESLIWIRCVEAGRRLRHSGSGVEGLRDRDWEMLHYYTDAVLCSLFLVVLLPKNIKPYHKQLLIIQQNSI